MGLVRSSFVPLVVSAAFLIGALAPRAADAIAIDVQFATVRQHASNQVPPPNQASVGVGGLFTNTGLAGVLFYELPASAPTQAELSILLAFARDLGTVGQVPDSFNVDLYSLGARSQAILVEDPLTPNDYGDDAPNVKLVPSSLNGVPASASLILDDWWIAGDDSQIGVFKTLDVTSVVDSAYSGGSPIDNFLVFALYADTPLNNNDFTTYVFTPEPSTALLVGAGLLGLAVRRRTLPT